MIKGIHSLMAIIILGAAPFAEAQSTGMSPGGHAARLTRGNGFGCQPPAVWVIEKGGAMCRDLSGVPPVVAPPGPSPVTPVAGVCRAGTTFEFQYRAANSAFNPTQGIVMWIQYGDGSQGAPTFSTSPYGSPDYSDSYPIASDADGVTRTGSLALPRDIPDGGVDSSLGLIPPKIRTSGLSAHGGSQGGSGNYAITSIRCSAGRITEIVMYGCSDCSGGGGG